MNQPKALVIFFLTEMWERYGFYVVEGLLVFYLTQTLSFTDSSAYLLLGEFTAFAFIAPVLGGWAADKFLGYRFSILMGGILLCSGYASLAMGKDLLMPGLSMIIVGNGLLKPNISSFLGLFYEEEDFRRDSGFTIFYMGINIGIVLSTLSGGFIKEHFGWHAVFAIASIGLLLGVITFRWGYKYFENKGFPPLPSPSSLILFLLKSPMVLLGTLLSLCCIYGIMEFSDFGDYLLDAFGVLFLLYLIWLAIQSTATERNRFYAIIVLMVVATLFWGLYFEVFFSINLFTERLVDRTAFNFTIPAPAFLGLEPIFVVLLGPFLATFWERANKADKKISIPTKFAFSLLMVGIAMQILTIITGVDHNDSFVNAAWMVLFYFIFTVGEMLISPIGLSMVTELTPPTHVGLMMGAWFMTIGFGGKISGILAQFASIPQNMHDPALLIPIYHHAFKTYATMGYIGFAVSLVLVPLLNRLIHR